MTTSGSSEDKLVLDEALFPRVWDFVQRTLLDPGGVYLYLNPPPTAAPTPTPSRRGSGRGTPVRRDDETLLRPKSEEDEEDELDRKARLRVGAFGATEWVLSGCPTSSPARMYTYSIISLFLRISRCQVRRVGKSKGEGEGERRNSYNRKLPCATYKPCAVVFAIPRYDATVRRYRQLWFRTARRAKICMVLAPNFVAEMQGYELCSHGAACD